jgi:hypothetical protein
VLHPVNAEASLDISKASGLLGISASKLKGLALGAMSSLNKILACIQEWSLNNIFACIQEWSIVGNLLRSLEELNS